MKPRLIILSDLWGRERAQWVKHYQHALQDIVDIDYYDCCELATIDKSEYTEERLHQQFIHGGIQTASKKLVTQTTTKAAILAFSIGGTIAWQAIEEGLNIDFFYAISSTRLRYQTLPISGNIQLYFGAKDPYKPSSDWFHRMKLTCKTVPNQGHLMYTNPTFIQDLCTDIRRKYLDSKEAKINL